MPNPEIAVVKEIFYDALEINESAEQRRFLESRCGSDAELRRQVEDLLRAHECVETEFIQHSSELNLPAPPDAGLEAFRDLANKSKYVCGEVFAQGGMGAILNAHESTIDRSVAMKIMLPGMPREAALRFVEEARITGQLEHPNIVPVHELNINERNEIYYTMKFVHGITLKAALRKLVDGVQGARETYSLANLLTIFQKICDAMAFAHSKGIIHRDLKPENVMLGDYGEVLVMDWGLAKSLGTAAGFAAGSEQHPLLAVRLTSRIESGLKTLDGTILGTPSYMAPEQGRGHNAALDHRADIYALGGILYEMLALRPALSGKKLSELLINLQRGKLDPLPAQSPELKHLPGTRVPESLAAVATKALALNPQDRYQSIGELQADIAAYQNGFATSAEEAGLARQLFLLIKRNKSVFSTAGAAAVLITGLALWFVMNLRDKEKRARAGEQAALASEAVAVQKKRETQQALGRSAVSLAEAALREGNGPAIQSALNEVPAELRDETWRYLFNQSDTSVARIDMGSARISGVAAHPLLPGVFALAGSHQKVLLINIRNGQRLLDFTPGFPQSNVVPPDISERLTFALAISPDGERIAVGRRIRSGNVGGGIVIHSTRDGRKLQEWAAFQSERLEYNADGTLLLQRCNSVVFDSNGIVINLKLANDRLCMWDAVHGRLVWEAGVEKLTDFPHSRGIFTPDGKNVLNFPSPDGVRLLNAADGKIIRTFKIEGEIIREMAMRSDSVAVAADRAGTVHLIDLPSGRVSSRFSTKMPEMKILVLSPKGERLVTGLDLPDGRQEIREWNTATGELQGSLLGGKGAVGDCCIHPLTTDLLVSGPETRAWNLCGKQASWEIQGLRTTATKPAFWGSDDVLFATGMGVEGALLKLKPGSSELLWSADVCSGARVDVSGDGKVAVFGRFAQRSSMLLLRNAGPHPEIMSIQNLMGDPGFVRLNHNGDRALVVDCRRRLALYDKLLSSSGQTRTQVENNDVSNYWDVRWLDGGERLLGLVTAKAERGAPGSEERIVVWDANTRKVLQSVTHPRAMDSLALAPDGRRFAEAGAEKTVRIRDTATLSVLKEFRAHDGPILALAWHPVKPILATASEDLTVRLWNLETGQRLLELRDMPANPIGLAFSPSGNRLACSCLENATRVWDLDLDALVESTRPRVIQSGE